jgi:hypothetical protein
MCQFVTDVGLKLSSSNRWRRSFLGHFCLETWTSCIEVTLNGFDLGYWPERQSANKVGKDAFCWQYLRQEIVGTTWRCAKGDKVFFGGVIDISRIGRANGVDGIQSPR